LVDSITPSASSARVSQKNAGTFAQNSEVENGFCLLYIQRKIDTVLTYYFYRKQHDSFKFGARERFERNSGNCCQRAERTAGMLNPTKQATLKLSGQRMNLNKG